MIMCFCLRVISDGGARKLPSANTDSVILVGLPLVGGVTLQSRLVLESYWGSGQTPRHVASYSSEGKFRISNCTHALL